MAGSIISDIMQMRQQGLSNNQVIQNLQRQGYTNTQIFDAMNQADTKMAVEGMQPGFIQPDSMGGGELFTAPPEQLSGARQPTDSGQVRGIFQDQVKMEELVEAIIEEKWVELIKDVNKIIEWKNRIENKVADLESQLSALRESVSDLNKAVLGRVNEYDKHLQEVGTDIKAMEKVFSKVLPTFTENVNELSRIASKMKSRGEEV